jgi:hypothetical protein
MLRIIYAILPALLLLNACTTDFEIEAPWKDIPVAYAFINLQDTAHYIRIEKAFLQPGANANNIAQIADSLYYDPSVTVQLEKKTTGQKFTLQRVDGNLEGYVRTDGPFAQSPNILYKIKANAINIAPEQALRLIINRGNGLPPVTAETTVLGPLTPRPTAPGNPLNLDYARTLVFITDIPSSAAIFDLRMLIRYREIDPAAPEGSVAKTLEWVIKKDLEKPTENAESIRFDELKGEDFFRFVGANIDASINRQRVFESIDLIYSAGGPELRDLFRVARANTGITSSQSIPVYTNLSEGRGIFSSRRTAVRSGLTLNGPALDSLRNGIYTRQLNFQ